MMVLHAIEDHQRRSRCSRTAKVQTISSNNKFKQNNLFVPGMGLRRASTVSFNCTRFRSESIFLDIQSR